MMKKHTLITLMCIALLLGAGANSALVDAARFNPINSSGAIGLRPTFDHMRELVAVEESKQIRVPIHLEIDLGGRNTLEFVPGIPELEYFASPRVIFVDYSDDVLWPADATWSSSDESIFVVNWNGAIRPVGTGTATVIAEYNGLRAEKELMVTQGEIERIEFWPEELHVIREGIRDERNVNLIPNLHIIAITSGGHVIDITENPNLTLSSDNVDIISAKELVSNANLDNVTEIYSNNINRGNSKTTGSANIAVSFGDARLSSSMASANLRVHTLNADNIVDIELVTFDDSNIVWEGFADLLVAYAVFDNGDRVDITRAALWNTNNDAIIEIIGGQGVINALSIGDATITATYAGISGSINLSVHSSDGLRNDVYIPFP